MSMWVGVFQEEDLESSFSRSSPFSSLIHGTIFSKSDEMVSNFYKKGCQPPSMEQPTMRGEGRSSPTSYDAKHYGMVPYPYLACVRRKIESTHNATASTTGSGRQHVQYRGIACTLRPSHQGGV
eukprot:scaffold7832_cov164-Amphora_coffeaeformis.AAC.4